MKNAWYVLVLALCLFTCPHGAGAQEFIPITYLDSVNCSYTGSRYMPFELTGMDGKKISNASIKGKVTLLYFWYADCGTCHNDFPIINFIWSEHKNDPNFRLIGINAEDKEKIQAAAQKYNLQFPLAKAKDIRTLDKMNFHNGMPTGVLIGKDGKVIYVKFGSIYYAKRDPNGKTNFYGKIQAALKK